MEGQDSKYMSGYIQKLPREFLWKKTTVMVSNVGNVINGVYYPTANNEKENFWRVLKEERIPHQFLSAQN